jgi:endothelin-converting enzyme/putative endopeptidase
VTDPIAADVLANMDPAADPCQDFFAYACGGWVASNAIPADQARWGRFYELRERNLEKVRALLEAEPGAAAGEDVAIAQARTMYRACMDEPTIEAQGVQALQPRLDAIAGVKDAVSLARVVGLFHRDGVGVLFRTSAGPDDKNPNRNILSVRQGGLGLPDRDYYLKDDADSVALRAAYLTHVERVLTLLGEAPEAARAQAQLVVEFETSLAKVQMPRAELRDPDKRYNKLDRAGLRKLAPQVRWADYFAQAGGPDIVDINVTPPAYFEALGKALPKTPLPTLRAYLKWHLGRDASPHLGAAFVAADFEFFGKTLNGQAELAPRWKRCARATDAALPEIVGRAFVDVHFAGANRQVAETMIVAIERAFEAGLANLSWMDDKTRGRAVEKSRKVANKIGSPTTWRDYSGLDVQPADHLGNMRRAAAFDFDRALREVGQPTDRSRWYMSAPTVNAYYNASWNEMVFPAGILQPPFFSADAPMAVNFGGIGMVMGHELSHGFDDQGRKYDGDGMLQPWWDAEVAGRFEARAACVDATYSSYEVQPGLTINGKLTLGENIADLGGLKQAHRAYEAWAQAHPDEVRSVPGLTDEQLLFVSFAQIWCAKSTPEAERVQVATDSHSHPRFRVNGPAASTPAFAEAFACAEGTPMHPKDACEVW